MIVLYSHDLDDFFAFLHRRAGDVELAMRKAARSVLTRLKNAVASDLGKAVGGRVREVEKIRMRVKRRSGRLSVELWVGSNPVFVQHLRPSVGKRGVRAGGRDFPDAFMPWKRFGDPMIFERKGSGRLPIQRPELEIDEVVRASVMRQWGGVSAVFFNLTREFLMRSEK